MKKALRIAACCLMLSGCGNTKTIGGVTYDVYGIANQSDKKNPNIEYEVSAGSIFVAMLFVETIVIPVYILLFDLWQPVGPKSPIVGQVVR
jgi:hypothetical protein